MIHRAHELKGTRWQKNAGTIKNKSTRAICHSTSGRGIPLVREAYSNPAAKWRVEYGKPFILLEDVNKGTFEFKAGQWAAHSMTIAECRESCLVKELPQKLNGMKRYEIRYPIPGDE